jgi:hypothetical protein
MPVLWTVVLRCHECGGKFTIRHLSLDKVSATCLVTPCPHCGSRPYVAPGPGYNERSRLHAIFYLSEETEIAYRKLQDDDTWHFNAGCSKWPEGDYLELEFVPVVEELCNECKASQNRRDQK